MNPPKKRKYNKKKINIAEVKNDMSEEEYTKYKKQKETLKKRKSRAIKLVTSQLRHCFNQLTNATDKFKALKVVLTDETEQELNLKVYDYYLEKIREKYNAEVREFEQNPELQSTNFKLAAVTMQSRHSYQMQHLNTKYEISRSTNTDKNILKRRTSTDGLYIGASTAWKGMRNAFKEELKEEVTDEKGFETAVIYLDEKEQMVVRPYEHRKEIKEWLNTKNLDNTKYCFAEIPRNVVKEIVTHEVTNMAVDVQEKQIKPMISVDGSPVQNDWRGTSHIHVYYRNAKRPSERKQQKNFEGEKYYQENEREDCVRVIKLICKETDSIFRIIFDKYMYKLFNSLENKVFVGITFKDSNIGADNKCFKVLSSTTGLNGSVGTPQFTVVEQKRRGGYKFSWTLNTIEAVIEILPHPFLTENAFFELRDAKKLPKKFILATKQTLCWNYVLKKNAEYVRKYPNRTTRLTKCSFVFIFFFYIFV